jgi:hypothetical protein
MSGQQPDSGAVQAGMDGPARQSAFLSALVTEHFVLQSAASTTVSEAAGRSTLYLSVLSSSLVALGFAAQSPGMFAPFAATVFPAVFVLGVFTVARLVDTGVQNLTFLAGIARIRGYYRTLVPEASEYFAPWGQIEQDRAAEALASLARRRSLLTGLGTSASMVAWVNSIVAGVGVALLCVRALDQDDTVIAVLVGLAAGLIWLTGFHAYQSYRYRIFQPPRP